MYDIEARIRKIEFQLADLEKKFMELEKAFPIIEKDGQRRKRVFGVSKEMLRILKEEKVPIELDRIISLATEHGITPNRHAFHSAAYNLMKSGKIKRVGTSLYQIIEGDA